jgi:hypothetical protein
MRREPDGSMVRHADLSGITGHGWCDIVVDGRGNIYLNSIGFDLPGGGPAAPGIIALVTPDGTAKHETRQHTPTPSETSCTSDVGKPARPSDNPSVRAPLLDRHQAYVPSDRRIRRAT